MDEFMEKDGLTVSILSHSVVLYISTYSVAFAAVRALPPFCQPYVYTRSMPCKGMSVFDYKPVVKALSLSSCHNRKATQCKSTEAFMNTGQSVEDKIR